MWSVSNSVPSVWPSVAFVWIGGLVCASVALMWRFGGSRVKGGVRSSRPNKDPSLSKVRIRSTGSRHSIYCSPDFPYLTPPSLPPLALYLSSVSLLSSPIFYMYKYLYLLHGVLNYLREYGSTIVILRTLSPTRQPLNSPDPLRSPQLKPDLPPLRRPRQCDGRPSG
jgi:hypothetical protein